MSYLVWKRSGLDSSKVIGTGTILETARLKQILGEIMDMDPKSIDACVMGEHGDSLMIPWSHVRIGGKDFEHILRDNLDRFKDTSKEQILEDTKKAGFRVLMSKGNTQYAIAMAVKQIVKAIVNNENMQIVVSACLSGEYGITGTYCGVPAIINKNGIKEIGVFNLKSDELKEFKGSVDVIKDFCKSI